MAGGTETKWTNKWGVSRTGALLGAIGISSGALAGAILLSPSELDSTAKVSTAQTTTLPATDVTIEEQTVVMDERGYIDFIIRFDDTPPIEACRKAFRENRSEGRRVFREWASKHPQLAGLRLKKASYSGEFVVTWTGGGTNPSRDDIMAMRERIQSLGLVRYADPDFTARVEETDK
ncbi:MAG: hypothetical protein AAFQ84_05090 [Pseudomonadota bacterium]